MPNRHLVSAAEFIRNIGRWQTEALRHPVYITHHGRERLVLGSPDQVRAIDEAGGSADAPDKLSELQTQHCALLESMEEGFLALDAQGRIEAGNEIAAAFLGKPRDALKGLTVLEAFPRMLALLLSDRVQRVFRTRKTETFHATGAPDGSPSVSVCVAPAGDGAIVVFSNTTEYEALKRRHEDADALSAALGSHQRAASVKLDARGRLDTVDETFCAWSGFAPAEVLGYRLVDLVPNNDRRTVTHALERVMRESVSEQTDITILGKKGEEAHYDLALAPILSDFVARGAVCVLVQH
ncbi:MAG: PAS domain-containing protein [Hyphomonadaceae bacterium]|nr:PAS domain-containing protein [Hyphomonadaceae bacterium]